MRRYLLVTMVAVLVVTSIALGRGQAPAGGGKAYRFEKIGDGVFFATGTGVMGHSWVLRQRCGPCAR